MATSASADCGSGTCAISFVARSGLGVVRVTEFGESHPAPAMTRAPTRQTDNAHEIHPLVTCGAAVSRCASNLTGWTQGARLPHDGEWNPEESPKNPLKLRSRFRLDVQRGRVRPLSESKTWICLKFRAPFGHFLGGTHLSGDRERQGGAS